MASPRRADRRFSAPPLVWTGVVVTLLACTAIVVALQFAARAESASASAEAFRRRLELLGIERDLVVAADRLEATALIHLTTGERGPELGRAQADFAHRLVQVETTLKRFVAAGDEPNPSAERMLDVVSTFRRRRSALASPPGSLHASDSLHAVAELYTELDWVVIASPDGEWFELSDFVHDLQIAASYGFDTVDEYVARRWAIDRPATEPEVAAELESVAAYLRALDLRPSKPEETMWNLDQVLDVERARALDPGLAPLVAGLRGRPGAQLLRDLLPYLLFRTDQPPVGPAELYDRMSAYSDELVEGARAAMALADGRIAAEEQRQHRRSLSAQALAVFSTLLAVVVLGAIELHRRRFNRHLHRLAETDPLTGLGNRLALESTERPRLADPEQGGFALINLDLDNFKAINDSFGHHVGDRALVAFAAACRHAVRADDGVARVGGDEFVIVLHRLADPEAAAREVASRIQRDLEQPVDCGGRSLHLQVSIGIATAAGPADLDEMMIEADLALYAAKERGSNRHELFADAERRRLVRELPPALASGRIGCAFQPQVDLVTGAVVGVEALARWPAAAAGEAAPASVSVRKLIDVVEWMGRTQALLRCVLGQVEIAWAETHGGLYGRYWINLSPADLAIPGAPDVLLDLLGSCRVPLDRIGVEVTESLPIFDFDQARGVLERLQEAGVAVAIDDFGSRNTPLRHLTSLPIDLVKLDRSVVRGIDRDTCNQVLAEAVRVVCQSRGTVVLAEGVESEAEIDTLRRLGVQRVQGYAVARPMGLAELVAFLGREAGAPAPPPALGPRRLTGSARTAATAR